MEIIAIEGETLPLSTNMTRSDDLYEPIEREIRLICMTTRNQMNCNEWPRDDREARIEALQAEYRRAWQAYTAEADRFQTELDGETDESVIERARKLLDRAADDYREARNALAEQLLEDAPRALAAVAGTQAA